jgi:hypothetical protein
VRLTKALKLTTAKPDGALVPRPARLKFNIQDRAMMTGFAMGGLWMLLFPLLTTLAILALLKFLMQPDRRNLK